MQRYSQQREVIMNILSNTTSHPTADGVYSAARKTIPNISLGTVYRNLSALEQAGKIISFKTADGVCHYDARVSPHIHFCCMNCGKVQDSFINSSVDLKSVEQSLDCSVEKAEIILYGKCAECNK